MVPYTLIYKPNLKPLRQYIGLNFYEREIARMVEN
jgi:hypothetical protein